MPITFCYAPPWIRIKIGILGTSYLCFALIYPVFITYKLYNLRQLLNLSKVSVASFVKDIIVLQSS